ncbi:uncharacterized protein [Diadema antillarum]|uniref:uncharacterized protein n=1 Tax=Diadema antillarum TaxID=105358 RepID=UPI003A86AB61
MASVLLYPIVYGLEVFLASALSTQIAVSLAAVLVSTAAVIYCQRTVALWWSLRSTTTQTRTRFIRPHAVVEVTEVRHEQTSDRPRDRGGGETAENSESGTEEKTTIQEKAVTPTSAKTTTTAAATRHKLSDDSEGSTEGSTNGEDSEHRRRKSSSGSKEGQPEQSWLTRQPAYMHRSHWVAKPAQPRNNPLIFKPSLLRRASADNNGHHQHRASEFARDTDKKRDDDNHEASERGGETPSKPNLDRRSSFPSSLPSATFSSQPPRTQTSSSMVTTSLTSSSTSSAKATPSCSVPTLQSTFSADDHGGTIERARGEAKEESSSVKKLGPETSCPSLPVVPSNLSEDSTKSAAQTKGSLPSISVMAPATIHEETESTEPSTIPKSVPKVKRVIPRLSFTTEVTSSSVTSSSEPSSPEYKEKRCKISTKTKTHIDQPHKTRVMPIICVVPESDKSDSEGQMPGQNTTQKSGSPPVEKSNELHVQFSVKQSFERPKGVPRHESLGIPSVVTGEIAYPGARKKRPNQRESEPLTITVQPPAICETEQAKDQNITQEVVRPIPQRTDSLGIPQVFTGEASFPMKQPQSGIPDDRTLATSQPKKPPGARRKESLEVPSVQIGEVSLPPVEKTLMGPPQDRPVKRHRPRSLDIPSLSASPPVDPTVGDPPMSAPSSKRKHASILKHGNSQEKPSRKKSVTFSPTVSPQEFKPEFSFDHESDGAIYAAPKRPKMFRHYSIDASESSYRKERYRASGRQIAEAKEAGILFTEDIPNITGVARTNDVNENSASHELDSPMETRLASAEEKDDDEESDDVFVSTRSIELSNAKARFLAAGGAKAVMSVLCTQDSCDSHGQGTKYSSVDLLEAEAKAISHSLTPPSEPEETPSSGDTATEDIGDQSPAEPWRSSKTASTKEKLSGIVVLQDTESAKSTTTLSSPIRESSERGASRFFSNEDLNLRASLLFVEPVRSSMESDLSEGRFSHSSEESEGSVNDELEVVQPVSTSAKSRFFLSCQNVEPGPKIHRIHSDDIWTTPTIPELPEPLEIDSQDEESTSAARDADIDESTSTSSSPSYSSSWYGFLELDPNKPSAANLGFELVESTDNDLLAAFRGDDDTGDEVEYDGERRECEPERKRRSEGRSSETDGREAVVTSSFSVPEFAGVGTGSEKDDVIRHQWQLATSSASSASAPPPRRLYNTPVIIDNGSEVIKAGLADGSTPSVTMPAMVGRLKEDIESFRQRSNVYVGGALSKKYGLVCVNHPMSDGLVDSWPDLEKVWDHVIREELNVSWEEHPILLTEIASAPRRQREKMLETLFEQYHVPACYVINQGALALHANGETSGLVLSSGSGVTEVIPVYQGCTVSNAVVTLDIAGRGVTRKLQRILMDEHSFTTSTPSDHRIVREMKENMAYVCSDFEKELQQVDLTTPIRYALPDGSAVSLRRQDLFHCTEAMFRPDLFSPTQQRGLLDVIQECLSRCDNTFLESIDPTILLAGGNTKLRGYAERLQTEMTSRNIRRTVVAHDNRDITTWIGGAILASHSSFQERWVSSQDYEECGARLAHKQTLRIS